MKKQEIEEIIFSNQFHTIFEPIVDIQNRTIYGYESLTRLSGKNQPSIGSFIAECSDYELTADFEIQTLKNAFQAFSFDPDTYLFVNLSYRTFLDSFSKIADLIRTTKRKVVFEFLETSELNPEILTELRPKTAQLSAELDTQFAIDDFGSGYADVSRILTQPADFVKTDAAFLEDITRLKGKQLVLINLFHFVRHKNKTLIVEGVEEKKTARLLN
ncbi:EAL domain-containing protein [Listeria floridensis FSL S10-1187]|uniref:EAL domain-containing protein n=1 Tax=Listeria floridensis FSL S10-1187 TaxID=1265817 RepID=A0ABN0RGD1_9LIST|nr:EAL domain-containing protein [Listeria floridensis]EUJ32941.1 EAL domain-containing protein [Listeria floridensis FSL S10-1187]